MSEVSSVIEMLKVLAHPVRIRIAYILFSEGASRVGDISKKLNISQPIVSQQLKILKSANVVDFKRQAKAVSYNICDESAQALLGLLSSRLAHNLFKPTPTPSKPAGNANIFVDVNICPQNHYCFPIDFCPEMAISQEGFALPVIDLHKCTLCGKCLKTCPYGAFVIKEK